MQKVALLLKDLKDLNATNTSGRTGFHLACAQGHAEILQQLLQAESQNKNINLNQIDDDDRSGFHLACLYGQTKVVELLLKESQKRKINIQSVNNHKRTGFHLACIAGETQVVKLLLKFLTTQLATPGNRVSTQSVVT